MKKVLIRLALILIMTGFPVGSVFAAEEAPPSINFTFDDDGDTPPSLEETSESGNTSTNTTPPPIPSPIPPPIQPTNNNQAIATLATNNDSTAISKTGPGANLLVATSLILGYLITKPGLKSSKETKK